MEPRSDAEVIEFCAGLPLVSVRPFNEDERSRIQLDLRRTRLLGLLSFTPIPLVVLVWWALTKIPFINQPPDILPAVLVTFTLLAIPLSLILPYFSIRSLKRLRRETNPNRVERFGGRLDAPCENDVVQRTLFGSGLLQMDTSEQWIEIIPGTGRVLYVNGRTPPTEMWVEKRTVASPVTTLSTIPTVNIPGAGNADGSRMLSSRVLNSAEIKELKDHARRAWRPYLWPAVLLSFWFFPLFGLSVLKGQLLPPDTWNSVSYLYLGALTCLTDIRFFAGVWNARQLGKDIQAGTVTISVAVNPASVGTVRPAVAGYFEVLPHSGKSWTKFGSPAPWRKAVTV